MKPVMQYQDYRALLRDYYRHKKSINHRFSYRLFARLAQYKSPSLFREIATGKKNLTPWMVDRFGKAMRLSDSEHEWLRQLVISERGSQSILHHCNH